ncbi:histone-lysine N-methyltransferase SETMAR [Trichonephila clavipes]|nr:histone-lysine N-methyltransferase SETMAR [Trichonephila clavipes]
MKNFHYFGYRRGSHLSHTPCSFHVHQPGSSLSIQATLRQSSNTIRYGMEELHVPFPNDDRDKEKIRYILQFFIDKGENAGQVAEIVKGDYGVITVKANYVQFGFVDSSSSIFDVKNALRTGRPVVEIVDKITEIMGS